MRNTIWVSKNIGCKSVTSKKNIFFYLPNVFREFFPSYLLSYYPLDVLYGFTFSSYTYTRLSFHCHSHYCLFSYEIFVEAGLFFRELPSKTTSLKKYKRIGGKQSKKRVTVLVCVYVDGKLEKALVFGKATKRGLQIHMFMIFQ